MKCVRMVLLVLIIASAMATTAAAQAPDSTAARAALLDANPETLGQQAAELLESIRDHSEDYRAYQARILNASHEDSLVLQLQIDSQVDRLIAELPKLANYYPRDPQTAGERELQGRIEAIYNYVTPDIWVLIDNLRQDVNRQRSLRSETDPAGRGSLEIVIAGLKNRLDVLSVFAGDHLRTLDGLGFDVTESRLIYHEILEGRANDLEGRIMLASDRITEYNEELKDQAGNGDLVLLQKATRNSLDANTTSMDIVLNLMATEGLDTNDHRAYLVTVTQNLASGILDAKVAATLLRKLWQQTAGWITTKGPGYLVKLLIFVVIMFAGRLLAKLVHKAVDTSLGRARVNISQLLRRTLVSTAHNAILAIALMIGLSQVGLDLGPLLAGFGVIGFILGFAMQDSLSNFASGLMILFYRPYDVGDLVDISGVFGKVENMSLVSTSILTLDNQKLVVPNSKIWGDVIKNVTDQHTRRVDMTFGISYTDDIPHAEKVLSDILEKHAMVLDKPESMVKLHTLNDSSVDFVVRPWVKTEDYWDVYWDVTREVKMRFDAENISIPFPQQDVHIHQEGRPAETED
ncbi:MAG: mechanosensitive ion channel family protein [Candidatus Krumholzibacteria bacterium]|nr:mechanosensitive ion channel family protein [Candidatus Krumholzibacteria bacterium]